MVCQTRDTGKLSHWIFQNIGEILDKGTAARGTGLVDFKPCNALILNIYCLHILATDIQYKRHFRVDGAGGQVMRHGFHHAFVQIICCFNQILAITRSGTAHHIYLLMMLLRLILQTGQRLTKSLEAVAFVAAIVRENDATFFVHQHQFGCSGARVNTQVTVLGLKILPVDGRNKSNTLLFFPIFQILFRRKQSRQAADMLLLFLFLLMIAEQAHKIGQGDALFYILHGDECTAPCGNQLRTLRHKHILFLQFQQADKGLFQF